MSYQWAIVAKIKRILSESDAKKFVCAFAAGLLWLTPNEMS